MEWRPTNPNADPQISGYHIIQEFSSFVTSEQLEYKRKNMTPGMFAIAGILEIKPQIKAPRVTPLEGVYTYCFAIRGRGVENPQGFGIDERRFVVRY